MKPSVLFGFLLGLCMASVLEAATLTSSVQNSIETRVIVDRWAFNSWKSRVDTSLSESTRITQTKTAMTEYIHSAFHDLNSVFKGLLSSGINLDARIVSIEFITDEFVTLENPSGSQQGDGETVLKEFSSWLDTQSYASTDHTMLLTGLDLRSGKSTGTSGKAYVGGLCSAKHSISVSEASPSSSVVLTMAHELGHNMNSDHDGPEGSNDCSEGYIMENSTNSGNGLATSFQFSTCSVSVIKDFLQNLHNSGSCLSASNTALSALSSIPLGERYTPDKICQLNYGSSSFFCRYSFGYGGGESYSSMCATIYCKDPSGGCQSVRGSDGFVCGQGKKCSLGQCLSSESAPTTVTDSCPQGDINYPMNDAGQTCSQAIAAFKGNCYQAFYRSGCCVACEAVKKGPTGCEFGDKSPGCAPLKFPYACYAGQNGATCCGSCLPHKTDVAGCEYGDKASFCGTASYPQKDCYYGNDATCCSFCKDLQTGISGCEYGDKEAWCADFIASNPNNCERNSEACCKSCQNPSNAGNTGGSGDSGGSGTPTSTCVDKSSECAWKVPANPALCYNYESVCCASCAKVVSGTGDCKYGDKSSDCATLNYPSTCYRNEAICCGSCAKHATGSSACKYGDRYSGCHQGYCQQYADYCCATCA